MTDNKIRMFGKMKNFNGHVAETEPIQNSCGLLARLWVHHSGSKPNEKWDENIVCEVRKSNKINLAILGEAQNEPHGDSNILEEKFVLSVGTEIKSFTIHKKNYHWSWLPEVVMNNPRQHMILEYRTSSSMRFSKRRINIQPARVEKLEKEIGILGIELALANSDPGKRMPRWKTHQRRRDPKQYLSCRSLSASAKVFTVIKNNSLMHQDYDI
mmetsp:Transcript_27653/g.38609  ORF Transcript_27653/g.38609 Transcript_27653/m.38609 type:complete len:213 (+) Transcript_27653:56-694(+)